LNNPSSSSTNAFFVSSEVDQSLFSGTGGCSLPLPTTDYLATLPTPVSSDFTTFPLADPLLNLSFLDSTSWSLLPVCYPPTLPSPALLDRLIDVFFTKQHLATGLVSEVRLRSTLVLPRTDLRAPLECLLHAIAATAALMVGDGFIEGEEWQGGGGGRKYWAGGAGEGGLQKGDGAAAFSEYHAKRAVVSLSPLLFRPSAELEQNRRQPPTFVSPPEQDLIEPSFRSGLQLLQIVQTTVLGSFCAYTSGAFSFCLFPASSFRPLLFSL
jgi:hypothetical protein